jgi:hypothetical protein
VHPAQAMGILKTQCLSCHNAEKKKGGLSLETRDLALKGGENGAALKAGDAAHSALITSLTDSGRRAHAAEEADAGEADQPAEGLGERRRGLG